MDTGKRSPLRLLAPIALVVFGVALLLVVSSGNSGGGGSSNGAGSAEKTRDLGTSGSKSGNKSSTVTTSTTPTTSKRVYIVKSGDTLGGIAEKTGLPVEKLQELNPGLDQFSLVAGQRIKLR